MLLALSTALASWVLLCLYLEVPALRIGSFLGVVALYLWILADAVRLARRSPEYTLRRYNRGWVFALVVLISAFALQPAFQQMVGSKIARAYSIPGASMLPTLAPGDLLYVSPRVPTQLQRASLVVWHSPEQIQIIQRVVALPGDTVEMRAKALFVNGRAVREPYVQHTDPNAGGTDPQMLWQREHLVREDPRPYRPTRDTWGPLLVPTGHYLLLGDNRDNTYDSRYRGFVRRNHLTDRPVWVYASRDPETGRFRWSRFGMSIR
jgi:signal peptidase I